MSLFGHDTPTGWLTSTVTPRGAAAGVSASCVPPALGCTRVTHDEWGRVGGVTDANSNTSTRDYDANGNLVEVIDANANTTTLVYDDADQPTSVQRPDGTTTQATFWPDGSLKASIDGAGEATSYDYDPQGRLVSTTDPTA